MVPGSCGPWGLSEQDGLHTGQKVNVVRSGPNEATEGREKLHLPCTLRWRSSEFFAAASHPTRVSPSPLPFPSSFGGRNKAGAQSEPGLTWRASFSQKAARSQEHMQQAISSHVMAVANRLYALPESESRPASPEVLDTQLNVSDPFSFKI